MPPKRTLVMAGMLGLVAVAPPAAGQQVRLSTATLRDRIRGGRAGKTIGVIFGGPTEFVYTGTMIQDYQAIVWYDGHLKDAYETHPGLYDDLYVDPTFVNVIEREGLDAPAREFAKALAGAGFVPIPRQAPRLVRRFIPFWRYQLPDGKHTVRLEVLNPTENALVRLNHAIRYGEAPAAPQS